MLGVERFVRCAGPIEPAYPTRGRVTAPAQAATPTDSDASPPPESLRRVIAVVARRLRWQRALRAFCHAGALAIAGVAMALARQRLGSGAIALPALGYAIALPLCAALAAALRRVRRLALAQRIDRSHGLADLIASSWAFSQLAAAERSRFTQATLERADTLARSGELQPARALPWRWPRSLWAWPLCALAALGAARLPPLTAASAHVPARPAPARLLGAEVVADQLRGMDAERAADDAKLRELSGELERLLELVAEGKIDRLELLRALRELEQRLAADARPDAAALREQIERELRDLGRALGRSNVTGQLGAALDEARLGEAAAQLRELARKIDSAPDLAELQRLREALRAALAQHERSKLEQRAKAARSPSEGAGSSLLRKQNDQASGESPEQQRKRKRELDELLREERDRRAQQQERPTEQAQRGSGAEQLQRELEQLERALANAAQSGGAAQPKSSGRDGEAEQSDDASARQSGAAARELERAAEALERMSRARRDERARQRLEERVAELRQLLAERRSAQPEAPHDKDQANQGRPLSLEQFRRGARGEPDRDAARLTLLQRSNAPERPGDQPPSGRRIGGGEEAAPSAEGRPVLGPERKAAEASVDLSVAGVLGRGPSRSAVIYDAASRGFGARAYQRVHADYAAHAEQELEREPLPPGYRFYVRRYFDLIQPPEDRHE